MSSSMEPHGFRALLEEADAYLNFFKKRSEIEEEYATALARLLLKTEDQDRKFVEEGVRPAPSTLRSIWSELRRDLAREADARKSYANQLRHLVLDPLVHFRDAKERVRRRIKDELKLSTSEHNDYRSAVSRLQKSYERKCEDVRNQQVHETLATTAPTPVLHTDTERQGSGSTQSSSDTSPPTSPSSSGLSHGQIVTGATATSTSSLQPPTAVTAANRAGDALRASRTGINSLIQRIGGSQGQEPHSAGGHTTSNRPGHSNSVSHSSGAGNPVKTLKAKREAEEADKEYRRAIFHLETLRMQRERVGRSALASAEEFSFDMSSTMKHMFAVYGDVGLFTNGTMNAILEHCRATVRDVSPELDVTNYAASLPFDIPSEPRIYYENCYVGQCKSLLFGVVTLDHYHADHPDLFVPALVTKAIAELDARGLEVEGLYRVPGRSSTIAHLILEIEKDEGKFRFDPARHDVFSVAGLLKMFLRQLPSALLPFPATERAALSKSLLNEAECEESLKAFGRRLRRLSGPHVATLKLLCRHLGRVAAHEAVNKMNAVNLGLVMAPVVFGDDEAPADLASMPRDHCMEYLISHQTELLDPLPDPIPSDPLLNTADPIRTRSRALSDAASRESEEEFPMRRDGLNPMTAVHVTTTNIRKSLSMRKGQGPRRPSVSEGATSPRSPNPTPTPTSAAPPARARPHSGPTPPVHPSVLVPPTSHAGATVLSPAQHDFDGVHDLYGRASGSITPGGVSVSSLSSRMSRSSSATGPASGIGSLPPGAAPPRSSHADGTPPGSQLQVINGPAGST